MTVLRLGCLVCLAAAALFAGPASKLYQEGRKAERAGEVARAYLLYSQAAALEPRNSRYWLRSQAVRTRAALQASLTPKPAPAEPPPDTPAPEPATEADLREARQPRPPYELRASPDRRDFNLRVDARTLFEQVAKAYGLDVVFDGDYPPGGNPIPFRLEQADYREALRSVQAATSSFLVPLGDRLFLVAKDTQQKRADLEPAVSVVIPIPQPVTVQEAQELARSVQQTMEIRRFAIDSTRRIVVLSDRISKVRPAQLLFEDLLRYRPEVLVELEFLEVDRSDLVTFGLGLPTSFPIFSQSARLPLPSLPGYLLTLGGGATLFGIGISDGLLAANMTKSHARTLLRTRMRSGDGLAATFHVGDKYPVLTAGYFGPSEFTEGGQAYRPPPTFNFEDLGLVVKATPKIHGLDEVSLDVEAEFKVLAGETLNGIPIISTRRVASKVRVKTGEWAILTGMLTTSEARTISGLAGLSRIPGLGHLVRQYDKAFENREVLILLKPQVLSLPPGEILTRTIWVGPEGRLHIPL